MDTVPNTLLTQARLRLHPPDRPDHPMTLANVVDAVNTVLYGDDQAKKKVSAFDVNYLRKLERGIIASPRTADYRAALRTVLRVDTDEELGFYGRKTLPIRRVDRVDRRAVVFGTGAFMGMAALDTPTMSLLGTDRPDWPPRGVGREHIDRIVQLAEVFEQWDNSHGGAAIGREIADAKLREQAVLLTRTCPARLRPELHTAVAHLAGVVAFMLFDAYEHTDAQARFLFALQCAEIGGDWHQRAMLLSSMARQAVWCGQADEGLTYIDMGLVRADRLTATERAMLHTVRARALAKLGPPRAQDALAAVGAADAAFAHSEPANDPSWMRFYDAAQHHGDTAHALYDVALNAAMKTEAASRFGFSVTHHTSEFARSRAISRTKLASLTMATADPREAAAIGNTALDDAGPVRSLRAADDLRELRRIAARHATIPEVNALRTRIQETVGVAA